MSNNNKVVSAVFNFNQHEIKTITEKGEVFFIASHITRALGFKNSSKALSDHVDQDDITKCYAIDLIGRKQKVSFVNESGMYALIFGSRNPQAKVFKKWVTSKVLPTIRKTGNYQTSQSHADLVKCIELSNAVASSVQSATLDAVLQHKPSTNNRFLLCFNHEMKPHVSLLADDVAAVSIERLAEMIIQPCGINPSDLELANLAKSCNIEMSRRVEQNQKYSISKR